MLPRREEVLTLIRTLPRVAPVAHDEAMTLVAEHRLWGAGWGGSTSTFSPRRLLLARASGRSIAGCGKWLTISEWPGNLHR